MAGIAGRVGDKEVWLMSTIQMNEAWRDSVSKCGGVKGW